jgi:N-acetylglucosaminyl-diphospho-decaprenol L-rhamnosyltransferase
MIDPDRGRAAGAARVAAVVVNYESGAALVDCVEGLMAEGPAELLVVDNGSLDGSVDRLQAHIPRVDLLTPGRNLGYGAAANRGVAATTAEYVLVCNPDLSFGSGAVGVLADVLASAPEVGLVGPLIRTSAGDRYPSARRFPSLVDAAGHALLGLFRPDNPFTRSYQQTDLACDGDTVHEVDWVSGACFLVRRSAFEQIGGFDEAYFMYAEDVDLCWRLGRAGGIVAYAPSAEVVHAQGISTANRPYRMMLEHHRSLMRFAWRSTGGWRRALLPMVSVGICARAIVAALRILVRGLRRVP